ncbi:hypothetical protein L6452_34696 [Arctium lappa]|uniref:Uncharacterized protein n=1 Tax=Arctium lappa TaxID=4217 RepID=A0ACB8YJ58_ARCLA|nr:hypothetical protein L6452_34696 [Arctium lappa]
MIYKLSSWLICFECGFILNAPHLSPQGHTVRDKDPFPASKNPLPPAAATTNHPISSLLPHWHQQALTTPKSFYFSFIMLASKL